MEYAIAIIQLLSLVLTALSTRYFLRSARVVFPEPPKAGDTISASYPQALSACMVEMSNLNKTACMLLTFAIALQGLAWLFGLKI